MFGNTIPALVVTAGLLQVVPPIYGGVPRELPPRVLPLPLPQQFPQQYPRQLPRQMPQEVPVAPGCLSRGDARAAVQSGQVVPLSSVLGQIRNRMNGDIVSAPSLCNQGGRLIYFLDVLVDGRVIRLQVDGQTGRVGP
jgi:hypothetical protein